MKVTKNPSGISYVCFRGKCGYRGYTGAAPSGSEATKKFAKLHIFDRPTRRLSEVQQATIINRYGITPTEQRINGFRSEVELPRLAMPIYDSEGSTVGYVSKRMGGNSGRKSLTYWHKEVPNLHYPRQPIIDGPIALVEDTLSSIRVARYMQCRALLGTHLADNAIEQLRHETSTLVLALDNDMIGHMARMAQRLRGVFNIQIVHWPKDPKDMEDDEVKRIVSKYVG